MLTEVARRGSFSAAAEAMSFTPSAVSQQMSALARDTGVALFERTPRGMRLTESAEALVAHAHAVFARLGDAQAELEAIAGGAGGRLRFGSFPTATMAFAARAMQVFRDRCPGIELHFADGEPYENVARLKERQLDLAVLFDFDHWTAATDYDGRAVCDDRDIECTELFDDPFRVVVPASTLSQRPRTYNFQTLPASASSAAPRRARLGVWTCTSCARGRRSNSSSNPATGQPTSARCRRSSLPVAGSRSSPNSR